MGADRLAQLRIRTTLVATAIVAGALVVAAVGMVWFVGRSLRAQLRDEAETLAATAAREVASGQPVSPLIDPTEVSVQVLAPGETPSDTRIEGDVILVTTHVTLADGAGRSIVVIRGIDDIQDAQRAVARGLVVGVPGLIVLTALVVFWVAGLTLAPVRAANERQRRFTADAAHELRSPLASIRQHAEVVSEHPDGADAAELARTVLVEVARLQLIVDDLLLLARLDEQRAPRALEEVDLDDIVLTEAVRLRTETDRTIDTHAVAAARVLGDASYLGRLVRNLDQNAAGHATSSVAFGLATARDGVTLTIDDDGPGVPAAERERVFDRFVRLDEARDRPGGGAGLGLAIAREIARAHGGDVLLEDSPLGGLRATVRLPRGQTDG